MTWAPDYQDVRLLAEWLHIDDTQDDEFLALWVTTASRNVDDFCGRQFGQVDEPELRRYPAPVFDRRRRCWVVEVDDIQDTTGLEVLDCNGEAVTDFDLEPANALQKGRPYERIEFGTFTGKIRGTGLWGWSAVPSAAPVGMLMQASRLAARRDSPFGVAGSPTDGSEMRLLAQLDPDFRTALKPYVRTWWAA